MVTEDQFISYFEKLAKAHSTIAHLVDGKKCFFEVEDPEELTAFDDALRNATGSTVMLLVAGEGELNDAGSNNHTQSMDIQLYLLQRKKAGVSIPEIRAVCIDIIKNIVGRTKKDAGSSQMIPGQLTYFTINNLPVRKVGPMSLDWYGYTALLSFTCPFGWKVDSGTWTDIPA